MVHNTYRSKIHKLLTRLPIRIPWRIPWGIVPSLVWFLFFLVIPLGIVLFMSLMQKGHYGQIEYRFAPGNYLRVLEPIYLKIILRSVWLASFTTVLCLTLAYPLSYFMARSKPHWKRVLLGIVVIPFWTNFIIRIYSLRLVLGENGVINRWLLQLSLIEQPLQLIHNAFGTYVGMVYNYLPFMVLPLFVALEKMDFSLLDAAYDLGATRLQTFFRVLLPLSSPGIITGSLFVFIPAFGEFLIPELLGGAQKMYVGTLITETFLRSRDWPFGSALSSILVLFTMVAFFIVLSRSSKRKSYASGL